MILEIFYDTTCPFCIKRAEWIKRNDPDKRILLSDVNRDMFMLKLFGVNSDDALQDVHAVYRNGKVIKGADVVRATLYILGYKKTLALINMPVMSWLFNVAYCKISENRHKIGW